MPCRIAVGVLIAVIAIVPVEDVQAAIGAGLLHDGHEPGVVGREKVGLAGGEVGAAAALELVAVDAVAVDVAHVELLAVLLGIGVAIEEVNAAVGGLLVLVLDDGVELPGEIGIWRRPDGGNSPLSVRCQR